MNSRNKEMESFALTKGRPRKTTINAVLAACAAGLMTCVALNGAEAAKGGYVRAPTTGTAKPGPSPVVSDHRGQQQTLPPPRLICKRGRCHPTYTDQARTRDHRTQ
jgi:hypothetical protein